MLLLDTHALVWLASDRDQLTESGQAAIRRSAGRLFMSAISSLEIALLVKRSRLELPLPPEQFVTECLRHHGITEIPVDSPIAMAATAIIHRLELLSKDKVLPQYPGLRIIW
jgi:PIN domain nuclease of toxin-antitoxin system